METTNNDRTEEVFAHRNFKVFASHNLKMIMEAGGIIEFLQTLTLEVSILPLPNNTYEGLTFIGEALKDDQAITTVMMFLSDNKGLGITSNNAPEEAFNNLGLLDFRLQFNPDFFTEAFDAEYVQPIFQGVMSVPASSPENDGEETAEYDVSITFTAECTLTLFDK